LSDETRALSGLEVEALNIIGWHENGSKWELKTKHGSTAYASTKFMTEYVLDNVPMQFTINFYDYMRQ